MKQLIQCMGMLMLLFGLSSRVSAQITLVKDGKATSRIVLVEKNEVNEQAATLLQDFVKRISQATLPIVADTKARHSDWRKTSLSRRRRFFAENDSKRTTTNIQRRR